MSTMPTFSPQAPLAQLRSWLLSKVSDGAECPVCTQHVQVYRWSLYSTAGQALILFYRLGGTQYFVHSRSLKRAGHTGQGDASRLKNWGLLEEEKARRADGGRSGYWRVTPLGEAFVRGNATVPKYAHVYNNRVLKMDGPDVTIHDVLGNKFSYSDLMAGL